MATTGSKASTSPSHPPDFLFLRRAPDGGWETGAYERGRDEILAHHPDEPTACAHLLRLLV